MSSKKGNREEEGKSGNSNELEVKQTAVGGGGEHLQPDLCSSDESNRLEHSGATLAKTSPL